MISVKKLAKKIIIRMLTLKQKVKHHFMKQNDYILEGGKQQSVYSFSFSTNKFLSFFASKMNVKKNFVEKLQQ
jgi:hypothetical protein